MSDPPEAAALAYIVRVTVEVEVELEVTAANDQDARALARQAFERGDYDLEHSRAGGPDWRNAEVEVTP